MQNSTPPPTNFKDIQAPINTIIDSYAREEDKDWEERRKTQDGVHGLKLEKVLFEIAIYLIKILTFLLIILVIVWFWHLIAPCYLKWLNHEQVQSIERILFASTLVSFIGKYFSKYKILEREK